MKIFTNKTILDEVTTFCKTNKKRKDFTFHYLYVTSVVYLSPYTDRRYQVNDFVPINFELLETLISKQECANALKNLLDMGILETDNKVIRGAKSKGYRITEAYRTDKFFLTPIKDKELNEKLDSRKEEMRLGIDKAGHGYRTVNYWLQELEIDEKKAKKYIYNNLNAGDWDYECYFNSTTLIASGAKFATVDNKGKRFHNNLTNLPTPLRKFTSINGEKLWNVDIKNSQVFFLAMVMRNFDSVNKEELDLFTELARSGQFYEYMCEQGGLKLNLNDYQVRKDFKQAIFSGCLFDRNRAKLSKWETIFNTLFPTIFTEVRRIKSKDYNAMAIALQKEEARFIFKCVEVADKELKFKAPLLTIHDSIVSNKTNIDMVLQIMENEFGAQYGVIPMLEAQEL